MNLFLLSFIASIAFAIAQIPCDSEYGEHCPSEGGWAVGTCLKGIEGGVSSDCQAFINMQDACKDDIDTHCAGKEYTGDLLVCLSEWTKPDELTSACLESIPKKEQKARVMSDKEKKKAAERRRQRNKAAKYARDL
jgi:hypothetical protein